MSLILADRVQETTTTTGTGTINLGGATTQCQSFVSGIGTGNETYYCIISGDGTNWEVGIGTVTSGSPNTLSRTTVLSSSNSNTLVSLSGTSTVFCDYPARLYPANPIVAPPTYASSAWTELNISGTATVSDSPCGPVVASNDDAQTLRGLYMAAPTPPYTVNALLTAAAPYSADYLYYGLCFTDGTKIETLGYTGQQLSVQGYTNATTYDSNIKNFTCNVITSMWFSLADDGTNVYYRIGGDGYNWWQMYSAAKSSDFLGSAGYTNIGFFMATQFVGVSGIVFPVSLRSWNIAGSAP